MNKFKQSRKLTVQDKLIINNLNITKTSTLESRLSINYGATIISSSIHFQSNKNIRVLELATDPN